MKPNVISELMSGSRAGGALAEGKLAPYLPGPQHGNALVAALDLGFN